MEPKHFQSALLPGERAKLAKLEPWLGHRRTLQHVPKWDAAPEAQPAAMASTSWLGLQEGDVLPEQRQPSQPLTTSLGRADGRAEHGSSCRTRLAQTGRPSLGTHKALTQSRSHSARRRDERPSLNRLSPSGLGRLFITPLTVARGMC